MNDSDLVDDDLQPCLQRGSTEPRIEGRYRGLGTQRDAEYAAVGQREAGRGTKLGEKQGLCGVAFSDADSDRGELCQPLCTSPVPCRADQHLGEGDRMNEKPVASMGVHQRHRSRVMSVARVEQRDDDARIDSNHAGQSLRRSSR